MAFGQIDPARLQGKALRRWYLRSPAEIEEERGQKAAGAYDAFFAPVTTYRASEQSISNERISGDHASSSWQQLDGGPWRGEQICGRLQDPRDVAICRGTASARYAHCLRPDGTIGFPHLETKGGRRR